MLVQETQLGSVGNYLTLKAAARLLGKSERALYQAVRLNGIPRARVGRTIVVQLKDLEELRK